MEIYFSRFLKKPYSMRIYRTFMYLYEYMKIGQCVTIPSFIYLKSPFTDKIMYIYIIISQLYRFFKGNCVFQSDYLHFFCFFASSNITLQQNNELIIEIYRKIIYNKVTPVKKSGGNYYEGKFRSKNQRAS